jgi:hypothetical protein
MIVSVYAIVLSFSIALLLFSYFHDRNNAGNKLPFIKMTGWFVLFMLSLNTIVDGVQYQTGSNITIDCQMSGQDDTECCDCVAVDVIDFSTYENRTVSIMLAIVSFIGFVTVFFDLERPSWSK